MHSPRVYLLLSPLALASLALLCIACAAPRQGPIVKRTVAQTTQDASTTPDRARDPLIELLPRIDAITGQPILVLLPPELHAEFRAAHQRAKPLTILLDDGTRLRSRTFDVFITPAPASNLEPADPDAARLARWLGPRWAWSVREWDAATPSTQPTSQPPQAGLLVIEPPLGSSSAALWLGDRRVPVQWLPSAPALAAANPAATFLPTLPAKAFGSAVAQNLLREKAANPLTRWRSRLAIDGLALASASTLSPLALPNPSPDSAHDSPLELLANQQDQRWQSALTRLHIYNPDLCERLRARLAMFVLIDGNLPVPAWEQDLATLEQLLDDLLDPRLAPQRRAEYAEAFLTQQPAGVAWITDDGGLLVQRQSRTQTQNQSQRQGKADDLPREPWASVALANLLNRPTSCTILALSDAIAPEPRAIDPGQVILWTAPLIPAQSDDNDTSDLARVTTPRALQPPSLAPTGVDRLTELDVSIGPWSSQLVVLDGILRAQPPGLATGPFQADLTMREWLGDFAAAPPDANWATAALIQRVHTPQAGLLPERAWEIFIELRVPSAARTQPFDLATDAIFLYAGPPGAPTAALRIARDGTITSLLPKAAQVENELGFAQRAQVATFADRWTARVPLPIGSIEKDGLMRLGLCRINPQGIRSSWPRAIAPWQIEPSRAAIDTSNW